MTKVRKVKRNKKYHYNINRKRLNKKRLPQLQNTTIAKAWNTKTSSQKNFQNLGLSFDVNKDIKKMNRSDANNETQTVINSNPVSIVDELERDAKMSVRGKKFKFSSDEVNYLTYLLDKYGEDFKAMSKDRKNYLQHTWKQLRYKINLFKRIPEQYNRYLNSKKQQNK